MKTLHSRQGFTLLEVLISMAILAISLTVILQIFSGALKASDISAQYIQAVLTAREKMDKILLFPQLHETEYNGQEESGLEWTVLVSKQENGDEETEEEEKIRAPRHPLTLFNIEVTVRWGHGAGSRSFTLRTMKAAKEVIPEEDEEMQEGTPQLMPVEAS